MKKFNSVLISFCRGIIKSALHSNNHYCLAVFQRSNLVSYIHEPQVSSTLTNTFKTYRCIGIALTTCYEKTCKGSEFPPNTVDSQENGDPGSTFSYDTRPCQIIQVKETSSTESRKFELARLKEKKKKEKHFGRLATLGSVHSRCFLVPLGVLYLMKTFEDDNGL